MLPTFSGWVFGIFAGYMTDCELLNSHSKLNCSLSNLVFIYKLTHYAVFYCISFIRNDKGRGNVQAK